MSNGAVLRSLYRPKVSPPWTRRKGASQMGIVQVGNYPSGEVIFLSYGNIRSRAVARKQSQGAW
jgi:hypothetical protein